MSVLISSLATIALLVLLRWGFRVSARTTRIPHLVAPACPNCGIEIKADNGNAPDCKNRLRDHLKECEQW